MTFDRVSISFDGRVVLRDFSMELVPHAVNCLMGPSGAGKTTILNLILGFVKPDFGLLTGFDALKRAAVFQEDRLIEHMTARQNVSLVTGRDVSPDDIVRAFEAVRLEDADKPVSLMSGGERRRVAIVRAVLYAPELLLLDEPFRALDDDTREKTVDFIRSHAQNATVLLVTHDAREGRMLGAAHHIEVALSSSLQQG